MSVLSSAEMLVLCVYETSRGVGFYVTLYYISHSWSQSRTAPSSHQNQTSSRVCQLHTYMNYSLNKNWKFRLNEVVTKISRSLNFRTLPSPFCGWGLRWRESNSSSNTCTTGCPLACSRTRRARDIRILNFKKAYIINSLIQFTWIHLTYSIGDWLIWHYLCGIWGIFLRNRLTYKARHKDDDRVVHVAGVKVVVILLLRLSLNQLNIVCVEQLREGQANGCKEER